MNNIIYMAIGYSDKIISSVEEILMINTLDYCRLTNTKIRPTTVLTNFNIYNQVHNIIPSLFLLYNNKLCYWPCEYTDNFYTVLIDSENTRLFIGDKTHILKFSRNNNNIYSMYVTIIEEKCKSKYNKIKSISDIFNGNSIENIPRKTINKYDIIGNYFS